MRQFGLVIILITLLPIVSFAQGRYDVWYFGQGVGFDFNSNPPDTLMDGAQDALEGTATICDSNGTLLYYTDGRTIWDNNHRIIPNGTGLSGSGTSVQEALIIQKPGTDDIFYVFTTSIYDLFGAKTGLHYSIIEKGVIVQKNIPLVALPTESVASYFNRSEKFFWIATVTKDELSTDSYVLLYKLNFNGVKLFDKVRINQGGGVGQLIFSPNGAFLGVPSYYFNNGNRIENILLFDFDVSSGAVSFRASISGVRSTSLAFSPNSKLVYFGDYLSPLIQVPIDSFKNKDLASTYHNYLTDKKMTMRGGLALGKDGRIYCNQAGGDYGVSVIHYPDSLGVKCLFDYLSIPFSNGIDPSGYPFDRTRYGLPNAVANLIIIPQIEVNDSCAGLPLRCALNYSYADSLDWIMGDGQIISSGPDTFQYTYKEPGSYLVKAVLHYPTHIDTFSKMIRILPQPEPDLGKDTLLCKDERLEFQIETSLGNSFIWENGSTSPNRIIDQEGTFRLKISNDYCAVEDTLRVVYTECDIRADSLCLGDRTRLWVEDMTIDSIHWDFGDEQDELHPNSTVYHRYTSGDTYSVSANIFKSGLERSTSKEISITDLPRDFLPPEISGCDPLSFDPFLNNNLYDINWSNGEKSAETKFHATGMYSLEIGLNGCTAVDSMWVEIQNCICDVYVPNAFSPNNDPYNPVFAPTFTCGYSNAELVIFSLWGEQIAKGVTYWDGTYQGTMCQTGTYMWVLIYQDQNGKPQNLQGFVHLIR